MRGRPSDVRSSVVEARVDVRTLATALVFYESQGVRVTSLCALASTMLEDFVSALEESGLVSRVEDSTEAKLALEEVIGKATIKRGRKALVRQIQRESLAVEGVDPRQVDAPILKRSVKDAILKGGTREPKEQDAGPAAERSG